MAFHLIAQSAVKQHLYDSYQLLIYQDLSSQPGSVQTLDLVSDFKLVRGNASAKDKVNYFLNTKIDFTIKDTGRFLSKKLLDYPETDFKAIIKKNTVNWFVGYITAFLRKYDFTDTDSYANFSIYDGLNRLKEIKTLSSLPTGLIKLSELVRTIFNELRFDLNIHSYINAFAGSEVATSGRTLWLSYIKVSDIIATMGENISYYDILEFIAKLFDYSIYQENFVWVMRSNVYIYHPSNPSVDGIKREVINYSTGESTVSRVSLTQAIAKSELKFEPQKIQFGKIDRVAYSAKSFNPTEAPYVVDRLALIGWENPFFKQGNEGWTVDSGSPVFLSSSVIIPTGGQISQVSGEFEDGAEFVVKIQSTCIRMILDNGDRITVWSDNPLFRIIFEGNDSNNYYLNNTSFAWDGSPTNNNIFGLEMWGVFPGPAFDFLEEYNKNTYTFERELETPSGADGGKVKIVLFGGANASGNNYPLEISAIHNYAIVERKIIDVATIVAPKELVIASQVSEPKEEKNIAVPFHDFNPYSGVSLWNLEVDEFAEETFHRSDNWSPDGDMLLETISKKIVKFHRNNRGYDLKFLPGKSISFLNLFQADLESESVNSYFLPIYEESLLLEDEKRFVIIEHEESSETVNTQTEFIF